MNHLRRPFHSSKRTINMTLFRKGVSFSSVPRSTISMQIFSNLLFFRFVNDIGWQSCRFVAIKCWQFLIFNANTILLGLRPKTTSEIIEQNPSKIDLQSFQHSTNAPSHIRARTIDGKNHFSILKHIRRYVQLSSKLSQNFHCKW